MMKKKLFQGLGAIALVSTVAFNSISSEAAPNKSAGAPTVAIIAQKMRALWTRPASKGSDGATTVIVHSVKIGAPRAWSILDGGGGKKGTKVWPAKVHWTYRTHYRRATVVCDRQWNVSCFKNGLNEWIVQQNGGRQTEKKTEEPTTMK